MRDDNRDQKTKIDFDHGRGKRIDKIFSARARLKSWLGVLDCRGRNSNRSRKLVGSKSKLKLRSRQRGQIAIFVALIFQVLFVLFAMVINIGLLVHQKINLQNSVDLAAYYGASQQAQTLNAIGHANYQIRQAWKLLAWRLQALGPLTLQPAGGTIEPNPYQMTPSPHFLATGDELGLHYYGIGCVSFYPFERYNQSPQESYCKNLASFDSTVAIQALQPLHGLDDSLGFVSLGASINALTAAANATIRDNCDLGGYSNWLTTALFYFSYKSDIINRRLFINFLAHRLSVFNTDFIDVRGAHTNTGSFNTLMKNLSPENRDSITASGGSSTNFAFYNSLGDCGSPGDGANVPPDWLQEIYIAPEPLYARKGKCGTTDPSAFNFNVEKFINFGEVPVTPDFPSSHTSGDIYDQLFNFIKPLLSEPKGQSNPQLKIKKAMMGYEKNPNCQAYVRVSAKASPLIPFAPFGRVTLNATAYAKPFGGRIGPSYGKTWPQGAPQSVVSGSDGTTDILIPKRVDPDSGPQTNFSNTDPINDTDHNLNYSRYPGDPVGLKSSLVAGAYGKSIWDITTNQGKPLSFDMWQQIYTDPLLNNTGAGDVLAFAANGKPITPEAAKFRQLEIAAVAPDLFDITYYSIEPDFVRNYLIPISASPDWKNTKVMLRGDIGWRNNTNQTDPEFLFGVKDQIAAANAWIQQVASFGIGSINYLVTDPGQILTSWQGSNTFDYTQPDFDRFGHCHDDGLHGDAIGAVPQTQPVTSATTGNCRVGGRTGYSVKLVDEAYLKTLSIINPPK